LTPGDETDPVYETGLKETKTMFCVQNNTLINCNTQSSETCRLASRNDQFHFTGEIFSHERLEELQTRI
jgi:hypothetical protein